MNSMFKNAGAFAGDLSRWDVSAYVYTLLDDIDMFEGAHSYNPEVGKGLGQKRGPAQ